MMEGLAVMGFVFGMVGVIALVRLERLTKTLKEKRNSGRDLQRRVMHCSKTLSDCGIVHNSELKKRYL